MERKLLHITRLKEQKRPKRQAAPHRMSEQRKNRDKRGTE